MRIEINTKGLAAIAIVATAVVAVLGAARAGELSPPSGPVSPTMRTLADVGDSVAELAASRVSVPGNVSNLYIESIVGDTQGAFPPDPVDPGGNVSSIYDLQSGISAPRDAASGLPTGKRQHKPISVTKAVDKASPLIMNALITNENLPSVVLAVWAPDAVGGQMKVYTVVLTNARVVEVDQGVDASSGGGVAMREHVAFTYQRISWTWQEGGIVAEDDWESPVAR